MKITRKQLRQLIIESSRRSRVYQDQNSETKRFEKNEELARIEKNIDNKINALSSVKSIEEFNKLKSEIDQYHMFFIKLFS
tara:strand:+ start:50 stop:292 length:243 start_codon:yes stop_codon:yes gene_type:complete